MRFQRLMIYEYSQSPSGRMCQKRHVFEILEITYFHPFPGVDIVLGRRDYHQSISMRFYLETVVSLLSQLNFKVRRFWVPVRPIWPIKRSRSKHRLGLRVYFS